MSNCLACGCHLTHPLYQPGPQPLAALNLPRTREDAERALRYPMNFHVCVKCGHVFNKDFDVAQIPYEEDSNLMFNNGRGWQRHLDELALKLRDNYIHNDLTVVDIGAGDGSFLHTLKLTCMLKCDVEAIAYEPGPEHRDCKLLRLKTYADYFIPGRDLGKHKPDMLVCRHVLEHMEQPREFITELAWACAQNNIRPVFVAEVPCIDRALATTRVGDFLYEHVSNFTFRSMRTMFESCGWLTRECYRTYNDEVVIWTGVPNPRAYPGYPQGWDYHGTSGLVNFLMELIDTDMVFWGGTGKGAAFLNAFHITKGRVIDSDRRKAGRYVPGTGQLIEHAESLYENPAETVLITTRWRAADIWMEIQQCYPCVKTVYVVEPFGIKEYTEDDYHAETS